MCAISSAAATAITLAVTAASTAMTVYSSVQQGKSAQAQADYNAKILESQAADAKVRGGIEANQKRQEVKQKLAAQQTQLAANGGDISTGSALTLGADSAWAGEMDAQTAQVNAMREAYGYQAQATGERYSGAIAKHNAYGQAAGSLLSGASSMASTYGTWKANNEKKS